MAAAILNYGFLDFAVSDVFQIKGSNIPITLVMIGQIIKKWQPFSEIQDGGDCNLAFLQLCLSDVIDKLQINVATFVLNLTMID